MKTIYLTLFLSLITVMHASNPDDSTRLPNGFSISPEALTKIWYVTM